MLVKGPLNWLNELRGWLGSDAYSTAWVAMVPDINDLDRPAWPKAMSYLRTHQLDDGGWGEPHVFFAHERTISTLAAIKALHIWKTLPTDIMRIRRGLAALRSYAPRLATEPHQPIGFEMLLPRLRDDLTPFFEPELPLPEWEYVDTLGREKLANLRSLEPSPLARSAWWVSMEMLAEDKLAHLDDSLLDINGSIATSTAATAAYLRARRLHGEDSPRAAQYLDNLMGVGGAVPFCWPVETMERVWALNNFLLAGMNPQTRSLKSTIESVYTSWHLNEPGLSYSDAFLVTDGDDTLVGYTVLQWAGLAVSADPVLAFSNDSHFLAYTDERGASPSVNIHALSALRAEPGFPHRQLARQVSDWLIAHLKPDVMFDDKWHYSPFYSVSHAIPAFMGWDNSVALKCISFLLEHQRHDGGWGNFGYSTLEETALCIIGLYRAFQADLLTSLEPLVRAEHFFKANAGQQAVERLWIGKTLFRPDGIVKATLFAAQYALEKLSLNALAIHDVRKTSGGVAETLLASRTGRISA
jgi:hypothetical protein